MKIVIEKLLDNQSLTQEEARDVMFMIMFMFELFNKCDHLMLEKFNY